MFDAKGTVWVFGSSRVVHIHIDGGVMLGPKTPLHQHFTIHFHTLHSLQAPLQAVLGSLRTERGLEELNALLADRCLGRVCKELVEIS